MMVRPSEGLSIVFSRKDTTGFSDAACRAHRQHMADMKRAGEKRFFCQLSHGLESALTALLYPLVNKLLTGQWTRSVRGRCPLFHRPQRTQRRLLRLGQAPDPRDIEPLVGAVASQRAERLATLEVPERDGPVIPATGKP